ncbi:MAG: exo-alpha-sialidase [Acidobacteria bacterium]|nr:exo-alpha-sialidase [Acidobacteriota bacterium]
MRVTILWMRRCAGTAWAIGPLPLTTLDDRRISMSNYGERQATAVVFLSARGAADEQAIGALERINEADRRSGILVVAVFPNPAETASEVRSFIQNLGAHFPVYRDPRGEAAALLAARVTPEAFLLDRLGVVVYRGSVEGLKDAAGDVLARRPVRDPGRLPANAVRIGSPAPARPAGDRLGSAWFSSELIFDKIPGAPTHHASTVTEAANGDLLVAWYGGSYESSDDQALFLARRKNGERNWNPPHALIRDSLQPPGNAVVFRDGLNRIWIVWGRMEASRPLRQGGGWSLCRLMYRVSEDHGETWSADRVFQEGLGALPRNVPILLPDRSLLLPMSASGGSYFLKTADNGKTWTRSNIIDGGGQPTVALRQDGSLLTLMRKSPRIPQSESRDGGLTWTAPTLTSLPNPNAGIAMTHLRNGHFVLVFNDSEAARTPLSVARSVDGGKTWERPLALETNPGEYSYPSVIQSADGKIHITYTFRRLGIKHVEMDEGWLARFQ